MFYVRHCSYGVTAQTAKATDQLAWHVAKKLHSDLDIYDSSKRAVVWGTFRLCQLVEVEGEQKWEILAYARDLAPLRKVFAAHQPSVWTVSHYDWATKTWSSVAHS